MAISSSQLELLQKMASSRPSNVIEIHQEDVHRQCRIIYRNGDVIEKTSEEVANEIKQLQLLRDIQFSLLVERLTEWCKSNPENLLMACFVPSSDHSRVYFFAVQTSNKYCHEFSRSLTRLEIEVEDSEQFNLINLKVLELPKMSEEDMHNFVVSYNSSL